MNKGKKKIGYIILLILISASCFQIININICINSQEDPNRINPQNSALISNTKQWIINGDFSSAENWTSSKATVGDPNDVHAEISGGYANYMLLGDKRTFSYVSDPIQNSEWDPVQNPNFPYYPDTYTINASGACVEHYWNEGADQSVAVNWERNITMPVNMSDYIITSASIQAIVNGKVYVPSSQPPQYSDGVEAGNDLGTNTTQYATGDYVRFYVLVSDLPKNNVYEIESKQPTNLGQDWPSIPTLPDTEMIPVTEESLIFYLTSVLNTDNYNFTLAIGMRIWCEDNFAQDSDWWKLLVIKSVNLTFNYERKMDQLTSVSWNQEGDKPSEIIKNPIVIDKAILNFKYKINYTWSKTLSPNSEIQVLINDILHPETIKLWRATDVFQNASLTGFDVKNLIDKEKKINLSIQVYLADEFELNRVIKISIDDVYLNISYTENIPDISTKLELYLNGVDKTSDKFIKLPFAESLNITIKYTNLTGEYISGALIQLEGKVNGTLDPFPAYEQYSIIVNTTNLGLGVKVLTVTAEKSLYNTQEINFFVEVTERETELLLYLNDIPKPDEGTIQLELNETLDVMVEFKDNITKNLLKNATIELVGVGELNETNGQYNIKLNASDLGKGFSVFTIYAQKVNYIPKSIRFYVEVFERKTELLLFIDNEQIDDGDMIQIEVDDIINLTVYFKDNITKQHLSGATVDLVGRGKFNETNDYYNMTINAVDLDQGITILTIFAQLVNYQSQSLQFFIKVVERATNLQLFINSEYKTLDPTFSLTIGQNLNITVKYTDNDTGNHIDTALIQLIGQGLLINLTKDDFLEQYYTILDTTTLGIGVKLFSIVAQANNFQIKTIDPRITVNRIMVLIELESGSSQIEAEIGDDVSIQILLNDTIFGSLILNAYVTYRWAYGIGNFTDLNNDGIYEATLNNVQEGIYPIIITAFAGDDYDFEIKQITLVVTRPEVTSRPDLGWIIYILLGAIAGLVVLFTLYQTHFKYPPLVRKIRKLKKKVRKGSKTKPILVEKREDIIGRNLKEKQNVLDFESIQTEKIEENITLKLKNNGEN
ncbi:MAG: hypothetical protein ACFFEY_15620 [Candidatus Thorarchaeota archaeon]